MILIQEFLLGLSKEIVGQKLVLLQGASNLMGIFVFGLIINHIHRTDWCGCMSMENFQKKDLDHVNKVKDDNRIVNLRLATKQENKQNHSAPQSNNKSGYLGVSWNKRAKKWKAQIQMNGKVKYLGLFKYSKEAYEAYLKAKRELHTFWVEDQQQ
jgi:hypothetical protein